jgi:hypothetical protein
VCLSKSGGGYEIRTREGLPPTRFPSVRPRPLGESSSRREYAVLGDTGNRASPPAPQPRSSPEPPYAQAGASLRERQDTQSEKGPARPTIERVKLELREIEPDDVDAVQELIESDSGYTERITGYLPGSSDAQSLLMMRPDNFPEDRKVVLGAWAAGGLVAVVDLLRGYPNDRTVFIGLLEATDGTSAGGWRGVVRAH